MNFQLSHVCSSWQLKVYKTSQLAHLQISIFRNSKLIFLTISLKKSLFLRSSFREDTSFQHFFQKIDLKDFRKCIKVTRNI